MSYETSDRPVREPVPRAALALHGTGGQGRDEFWRLAGTVRDAARPLAAGLVMRTNGADGMLVFEKRVLQHLCCK